MIYPLVTGFHWADFDFQWYIEACRSRPGPAKTASGFHSVETFITQPVHPGTEQPDHSAIRGQCRRGRRRRRASRRCRWRTASTRAPMRRSPPCPHSRRIRTRQATPSSPRRSDDIADDGAARQVLRGQDPRRDRARAVPCHARSAPPGARGPASDSRGASSGRPMRDRVSTAYGPASGPIASASSTGRNWSARCSHDVELARAAAAVRTGKR